MNSRSKSLSSREQSKIKLNEEMNEWFYNSVIVRIIFVIIWIFSLITPILTCLASFQASPYIQIIPTQPIDGVWSPWTHWSECSITCASNHSRIGYMSRYRLCDNPPPQLGGIMCSGTTNETVECTRPDCPLPIHGGWSEWSDWTNCSASCQVERSIPIQSKSRNCSAPVPRFGGAGCQGDSTELRYCDWLPYCTVHGQWGPWLIEGPCESLSKEACSPGRQRLRRHCNQPIPRGLDAQNCVGQSDKQIDCWFMIGCPIEVQPPTNIELFSKSGGIFNLTWTSVGYNQAVLKYRLYLQILNSTNHRIHLIMVDHLLDKQPITNPYQSLTNEREVFWREIDLSGRLVRLDSQFWSLSVRISSLTFDNQESAQSKPVESLVRAVDGKWSNWSEWSLCDEPCYSRRGLRQRTRRCDNPSPLNGGKNCIGRIDDTLACFGTTTDC